MRRLTQSRAATRRRQAWPEMERQQLADHKKAEPLAAASTTTGK